MTKCLFSLQQMRIAGRCRPEWLCKAFWLAWLLCLLGFAPVLLADEPESGDGRLAADSPVAASDEGRQAMSGFRLPENWEVGLFAAEPALANPVALTVDNQGRVFVCESFRQDRGVTDNRGHDDAWLMADLAANSVQDRIDYFKRLLGTEITEYTAHDDRIRMLVDSDGDGMADRDTIFASGFNHLEDGTGAGILVRGNTAYYTCIPKLWALRDVDGDGTADDRQVLCDGLGVRVAFRGHDAHGLILGPDGRLYFSIGDRGYNIATSTGQLKNPESGAVFRCELDGSELEVFASGFRNPQELAFDDYGNLFTGDNNSDSGDKARWMPVLHGGDAGWRMMYQYIPDRGPYNRERIWHPYSTETPAYVVPPIANIGDGPSGLTCYPGTGLTGDYENCFFMADFRGGPGNSGVRLIRNAPSGAFWKVERSEEPLWNILATDCTFGPDGALWVCDWVDGWVGEGKGRIYRFVDQAAQQLEVVREVRDLLANGFAKTSAAELGQQLRHADRRIRLEAQWELATRGNLVEFQSLLADRQAGTLPRLHAVWGLGQAARLQPASKAGIGDSLAEAMLDTDSHVRACAAQVVGDLRLQQLAAAIVGLASDPEPRVQYAACLAAGRLQLAEILDPAVAMLISNADLDPGLRHAGIMALAGLPTADQLLALKNHPSRSVRLAAVVALRKRNDTGVAEFLRDADPAVQLEAARAIHDVPALHSALPQLAALIETELSDEALVHRVLNATFRLGAAEAADQLAVFAGLQSNSDAMRVEALAMLAAWQEPGKLDRVMNRYMPLADRQRAPAQQALAAQLPSLFGASNDVVQATIAAASKLQLRSASDSLLSIVENAQQSSELRTAAMQALVDIDADRSTTVEIVSRLVADEQPAVRAKAIELLTRLSPRAAIPVLEQAVQAKSMEEQAAAWDALARIDLPEASAILEQGVQRYVEGGLPPDVWLNVVEAANGRVGEATQAKLEQFSNEAIANDPLEAFRTAAFGGKPSAGRALFFNRTELSCVRCHKVGETGGEVGPPLTEIGKSKDNRYLLESIVNPDAKIAEHFETVMLMTDNDQIISGILRKETPSVIELMDADGKINQVNPVDVVDRRKGKSAMPADLTKNLTQRELRDLVAYLSSLK